MYVSLWTMGDVRALGFAAKPTHCVNIENTTGDTEGVMPILWTQDRDLLSQTLVSPNEVKLVVKDELQRDCFLQL